ncbi:hypothetical protein [Haloquadratum walsbyi]|uniref:hypothetical protein n=1 Tax=Haloquadratum walsbyi TaxID=293091 RepID=UPI0023F0BA46|nr:hypothetical protein [Haloquadratum walsbyi]
MPQRRLREQVMFDSTYMHFQSTTADRMDRSRIGCESKLPPTDAGSTAIPPVIIVHPLDCR